MQRTLTYIITKDKSNADFALLSDLCHKSKNLYNYVNYVVRQAFTGKYQNIPDYQDLVQKGKFVSEYGLSGRLAHNRQADYISLKAQCSQQVLKQVFRDWKSFFKSLKEYKANKAKFRGCPRLPKYKNKDGLNVLTYTNQSCSFDKRKGTLQIAKGLEISCVKLPKGIHRFHQVRVVPKCEYFQIDVVYEREEINDIVKNTKQYSVGVDIGVDNLATATSDNPGIAPIIVNGRCIKSINQFYNKRFAELKQLYSKQGLKTGRLARKLTLKRKNKIDDYFHKMSRIFVWWCIDNNIGRVFVGHNSNWKQNVKMGSVNNQNFVQIPFNRFINMLQYKLAEVGIDVVVLTEEYTSKCSALDNEPIEQRSAYAGKRVKRGLFKTKIGSFVNADVNGSANILRKGLAHDIAFGKAIFNPTIIINEVRNVSSQTPADRGLVFNPVDKQSTKKSVEVC